MKVNLFAGAGGEEYELRHPWPADCFVQGGHSGVVISRTSDNYTTAYFEAFPRTPEELFIRGEGPTLEEAEDACWAKLERQGSCPGHEYEPRGYKNGGGFCKHCNQFKGKAFTGEELGQFCVDCGVGTTWANVDDDWYCKLHSPTRSEEENEERWRMDHDQPVFGPRCAHHERCCWYHRVHLDPHVDCSMDPDNWVVHSSP